MPVNLMPAKGPDPALAAEAPARVRDWTALPDRPKTPAVTKEADNPSVLNSAPMAQLHRIRENPFALSELEEQIADALERAAREAGIDIP